MQKDYIKFVTVCFILFGIMAISSITAYSQDSAQNFSSNENTQEKSSDSTKPTNKELKALEGDLAAAEKKAMKAKKEAIQAEEGLKATQEKLGLMMAEVKGNGAKKKLLARLSDSVIIIIVGLFFLLALKIGVRRFEKSVTKENVLRESGTTLRLKTVVKLINWLGTIIILITVFYMVAEKHGLNLAPLVAGAGIAGLAFGFGGQYLIRDIINGLFILIEDQFRINDVVKIGEHGGLVEDINLRITTLRDLEGRVIIIPNGEVKTVINYTKEYAQALLDVGVAYKENVDHVMDVIKEICKEMRKDKYFGRLILGDVEMFGVDDFADSQVTIKFRIKTLPIKQWEVMRELRRRLKNKFDELGIEIPFPHRTLYWGVGKDNEWVKNFADKIVSK